MKVTTQAELDAAIASREPEIELTGGGAFEVRAYDSSQVRAYGCAPGCTPEAPDWDGGRQECGGGLHFSPRPVMALRFCPAATHFVACPVALKEMAVHPDGQFPEKCKAKRVCSPIYEVDIDGERMKVTA